MTAPQHTGINALRGPAHRVLAPLTRVLARLRIHPNAITVLGLLAALGAAALYSFEHVRLAGLLILFGGVCDIFDGQVARLSGLESKFGMFFDSTLDRISEIVMFVGLLSLYNGQPGFAGAWMEPVIALALGGSLMVSYTRAKAESLGASCSVGLMQRGERILLIGFGSLGFGFAWDGAALSAILVLVAILTNATAVQRIVWVYRHGGGAQPDQGGEIAGKG